MEDLKFYLSSAKIFVKNEMNGSESKHGDAG